MLFSKKTIVLPLLLGLLALSCAKEELDFDKLNEIKLRPNVTAPFVNANLNLSDLLETDSVLRENPDGSLRIVFEENKVARLGGNDLLEVPDQDSIRLLYRVGGAPIDLGVALGTLAGAELEQVNFDSGYLKYGIKNIATPLSDTVTFEFSFTNAVNQQSAETLSVVYHLLPGETSVVDSVPISDFSFDFSNGGTAVNFIGVKGKILNPGDAAVNRTFSGFARLKSLVVKNASGYAGQRIVKFPSGSFTLDLSALGAFAEGMILANPEIQFRTSNTVGIPVKMEVILNGANKNNKVAGLDAPFFFISAPDQLGGNALDTNRLNKDNSNIVNFLANVPQQVLYSGNVEINPNGKPADLNFVSDDAELALDLNVEIPLELRAERMVLEEVVEGFNFSGENPNFIEEMVLFTQTRSSFPFDLNLQLVFLDSATGDSAAGINTNLLKAAPVDAQGRADVTNPVVETSRIDLNNDQIDGLLRSNAVRIKAILNTSNQGQEVVKLYTDYALDVKVALQSQINANL